MPQVMRTEGRKVTISCLVKHLVFEWRLEATEDDGTRIAVHVEIPEAEAHRLDTQRDGSERVPALTRRARRYGRTSRTRLNGVSAVRRTRLKPPSLSTSVSRCSPACAPSASPTSWLSEFGVQSMVEAA